MNAIVTGTITGHQSGFGMLAAHYLAQRWWWIAILPAAVFFIGSLFLPVFGWIGLLWLLGIVPALYMLAYYNLTLTPGFSITSRAHYVEIDSKRVLIHNLPGEGHRRNTAVVPLEGITEAEITPQCITMHCPGYDPVWFSIPVAAISKHDFESLINILRNSQYDTKTANTHK